MKRLFYLFMVFVCMLAGCNKSNNHLDDPDDPDNPDYPTNVTLDIETKRYTIPQEGQKLGVKLETDMEYNVMIPDSVSSWVRLIETRAVRTDSLIFQISANTGAQDRSAQIVIKGKRSRLSDTLHFIQYGKGITYVGDVVLETEQDLIDFFEAGYTKVQGSVTIQTDFYIKTLQHLGNRLTEITDSLILKSIGLTNLEGLSGLKKISGVFKISRGSQMFPYSYLESFEGLESLETIGGDFTLEGYGNDDDNESSFNTLFSFKGLGNLKNIGGDFKLSATYSGSYSSSSFNSLSSFKGLENLESIGGDFRVSFSEKNPSTVLVSLEGLESLQSVRNISISYCKNLELRSFCPLKNAIQNMTGTFKAEGNGYNPTAEDIIKLCY